MTISPEYAEELGRQIDELEAENERLREALAASQSAGNAGADIIGVLRSVHSALDGAIGDSDVTHVESDDELREEHPIQWAAQWLWHAIELLGETRSRRSAFNTGEVK